MRSTIWADYREPDASRPIANVTFRTVQSRLKAKNIG